MTVQQIDLFDQPIPSKVERLTYNQGIRLFIRAHWGRKKESQKLGALVQHMKAFFEGRMIDTIGRQDIENLLNWLRTERGLGAWMLIKARGLNRLMFNRFEIWKEDGLVEGHDVSGLLLPRKNPTLGTSRPVATRPRGFLSPMSFRGYIRAARTANDYGFESAFKLGIWFRLSLIDLENLNDDEIFEDDFEIRLQRRHTKTDRNPDGVPQIIELTEKAWAEIDRCRKFRKPGRKEILSIHVNQRRRFAKIRKIAVANGYPDITIGWLRRSASDDLLGKGYPREAVADALGHTTDKMLDPHYSRKKHAPFRRKITAELVGTFK